MAKKNPFKMKLKKRLRNKVVWTSLLLGLVPLLANSFGFPLPIDYAEIVYALLGILVTLGILSDPTKGRYFEDEDEDENLQD